MKAVVELINKDINGWLRPKLESKPLDKEFLAYADHELKEWFNSKVEAAQLDSKLTSVVRACSEALFFASAACLDNNGNSIGTTIREHFNPMDRLSQVPRSTKLLFTLFNGGKAAGSMVKFAKFYLIVDGNALARCNSSSSPDFVDRARPNLL